MHYWLFHLSGYVTLANEVYSLADVLGKGVGED